MPLLILPVLRKFYRQNKQIKECSLVRSRVENGGCSLNTAVFENIMEYRNFFENLKFINIVNFFCEDRLIINVLSLRWLIIKSPVCLFKIYFCIIKVNIVINSKKVLLRIILLLAAFCYFCLLPYRLPQRLSPVLFNRC